MTWGNIGGLPASTWMTQNQKQLGRGLESAVETDDEGVIPGAGCRWYGKGRGKKWMENMKISTYKYTCFHMNIFQCALKIIGTEKMSQMVYLLIRFHSLTTGSYPHSLWCIKYVLITLPRKIKIWRQLTKYGKSKMLNSLKNEEKYWIRSSKKTVVLLIANRKTRNPCKCFSIYLSQLIPSHWRSHFDYVGNIHGLGEVPASRMAEGLQDPFLAHDGLGQVELH